MRADRALGPGLLDVRSVRLAVWRRKFAKQLIPLVICDLKLLDGCLMAERCG